MSDNLPPLPPCPDHAPVAISTPVLLRSALEGPPISNSSAPAGAHIDPSPGSVSSNEFVVVAQQDGAAGNSISVEVSAPADAVVTSVQVIGNAITVVPARKARMLVNFAEDVRFNGTYHEAGNYPGTTRPLWIMADIPVNPPRIYCPTAEGDPNVQWRMDLSDGVPIYITDLTPYNISDQPETLPFNIVSSGFPSALLLTEQASDANQGVSAINGTPSAYALIQADAINGNGELVIIPPTFLTGGVDGSPGTPAAGIGQFSRVGPYIIVPPRTEPYDWFIAETIDSWRQVFD